MSSVEINTAWLIDARSCQAHVVVTSIFHAKYATFCFSACAAVLKSMFDYLLSVTLVGFAGLIESHVFEMVAYCVSAKSNDRYLQLRVTFVYRSVTMRMSGMLEHARSRMVCTMDEQTRCKLP